MTHQPDIVKRLRGMVQIYAGTARPKSWADEAADEIERLRKALAAQRDARKAKKGAKR